MKKTKKVEKPAVIAAPEKPQGEFDANDKKEIQVIEKIIDNRAITPHDAFGKLSRSQIELIKKTVAKDATDDELKLFITVCHGAQLNPFLRQAHLVPFWDSKAGEERRAIIVGIDGYRAIAESSGAYAGNDDAVFEGDEELEFDVYENRKVVGKKKTLVPKKATVTIYKIVNGERYEFTASARWQEYYPGERKGLQWRKMPFLMLGKVAEALALRKAFPKLLSGIYAQEEMDQAAEITPEQKTQKGFDTLMAVLKKTPLKNLEDFREKMQESDKYTNEQKKEFSQAVDARIDEINHTEPAK